MLGAEGWKLYSGAQNKGSMLHLHAEAAGIKPELISQDSYPCEVIEANDSTQSAFLYTGKASQIWDACSSLLGENIVGFMNDVHPKKKRSDEDQYKEGITKIPEGDEKLLALPFDQRRSLLADAILEGFEMYDENNPVDLRISVGVVPFVRTAMLGLIVETAHEHYPVNPFPSRSAVLSYLDYCREYNLSVDGEQDNFALERNVGSAGGVLHRPLMEWFIYDRKKPVVVDVKTDDPLTELDHMGSGFTSTMVRSIITFLEGFKNTPRATNKLVVGKRIPIFPDRSRTVVWSPWQAMAVALDVH